MISTRALFTGSASAPTPGTWTPDGSPASIDTGSGHKAFPGVAFLAPSSLLLVYRSGTSHLVGGDIVGRIGALTGTSVSWGSEFTIYDHASLDVRCENAVSVIGTKVVIAGRHYDGSDNHAPFVLVCDDDAADCDDESTWTKHDITFAEGDEQNYTSGRVLRVSGKYVLGVGHESAGENHEVGVLLNDSLTDWSSPTFVTVGPEGSADYSEISIDRLWGPSGRLLALIRRHSGSQTYRALSTDGGATWTSPASAHDGFGYPMLRQLDDRTVLTVYRDSPDGDTAWRTSTNEGTSFGSETILDTTGARSVYATLLQLDYSNALCVYAVEGSGGSSATDADLYSQVFTRA